MKAMTRGQIIATILNEVAPDHIPYADVVTLLRALNPKGADKLLSPAETERTLETLRREKPAILAWMLRGEREVVAERRAMSN